MSQSNERLEPRLVAVDSHTLSHVDDHIQSYSGECGHLGYALDALKQSLANDPTSYGILKAIQSALFRISVDAEELSEGIMGKLITQVEVQVNE